MKHLLSLFVLFVVTTGVSAQDASVPAEGLDWVPFEEAVEEAERLDKKLIVDIYAPWCPWCRRLQREVYVDASIQEYLEEHFVLTRLDGENQSDSLRFREFTLTPSELAIGLGAQGYPTTVFLDAEGEYITRLPGFSEAPSFLTVLSYVGSNAFQQVTFDEYRTRSE